MEIKLNKRCGTSLATFYRPTEWEEVCGQQSIIKILTRQLELNEIKNAYLLCGASGCGKTTLARIFANKINNNVGEPIEIDGASNNGVDNVKSIIKSAQERAINSKYKIYIIDECHMITNQGWNAFLKCIEEPPAYTIFIFCTTDPQKIPATILNRVQRYNISRISTDKIKQRLMYICEQENYTNYIDTCDYLSKLSNGGMRDAISMLEKCAGYSYDLTIENALEALGNYSYTTFFKLMNAIIDGNEKDVLQTIDDFYNQGNDLKIFVDQFLTFTLDIAKYAIFRTMDMIKIPVNLQKELEHAINFDNADKYYAYIVDKMLLLKQAIKNDNNMKVTIEVGLLQLARCQ